MKSKEVVRQELGNKTAQQFLKESLQVKDIEVVKKELNETKGKDEKETMQKRIGFLKSIIKDENYKEIKGEILRELAPLVEKVDKKILNHDYSLLLRKVCFLLFLANWDICIVFMTKSSYNKLIQYARSYREFCPPGPLLPLILRTFYP